MAASPPLAPAGGLCAEAAPGFARALSAPGAVWSLAMPMAAATRRTFATVADRQPTTRSMTG
jgi:hypothetical protein